MSAPIEKKAKFGLYIPNDPSKKQLEEVVKYFDCLLNADWSRQSNIGEFLERARRAYYEDYEADEEETIADMRGIVNRAREDAAERLKLVTDLEKAQEVTEKARLYDELMQREDIRKIVENTKVATRASGEKWDHYGGNTGPGADSPWGR